MVHQILLIPSDPAAISIGQLCNLKLLSLRCGHDMVEGITFSAWDMAIAFNISAVTVSWSEDGEKESIQGGCADLLW